MKKTQPIDWDKGIFIDSNISVIYKGSSFVDELIFIDKDFIAAFDEMLENYINKIQHNLDWGWMDCDDWNDVKGWTVKGDEF